MANRQSVLSNSQEHYLAGMKGRVYLIIGLLLGSILGWALGFLRLPLIVKNDSFWIGLLAGICLSSLVLVIRSSFGRKLVATSTFTKRGWIGGIAIFLVSGGLVAAALIDQANDTFKEQLMQKKTEFDWEQALIQARQQANLGMVMESLFEQVHEDVSTQNGKLSPKTIKEIARISQSFEPYSYFDADSLTKQKLSPERGQLLLFLISSKMDTASFQQAISQATFAGADLEGAKLAGLDLSGIDLRGARLKNAELNGVNLSEADLREGDFWGAHIRQGKLYKADMRRVDLRWAELVEADMKEVYLDGANLSNAVASKVDMRKVIFQWGEMSGIMGDYANYSEADFEKTVMKRANFSGADFTNANLRRTDLEETNLREANLFKVIVAEDDWLEILEASRVLGAQEIQDRYSVKEKVLILR